MARKKQTIIKKALGGASLLTAFAMAATPFIKNMDGYVPSTQHAGTKTTFTQAADNEELQKMKRAFYFDENGHKRGTLDFAWQRLKANAPESHQWAYETAEYARDVGVHPLVPLLVMANETGLREHYAGDGKDAQGPYQVQALWLIENTREYAQNTPFYKKLKHNDPSKVSLDHILHDDSLNDPANREARANEMARMYREGDTALEGLDGQFSMIRFNPEFMTQLISVKMGTENPTYQIANLPNDAEEAVDTILSAFGKTYSEHLKGEMGSRYLYALAEAVPDITIAETEKVQAAADSIQATNKWAYPFDAEEWRINTEQNRGPFKDGENTKLGDIPHYFTEYVSLKTDLVMKELDPIIMVASPLYGQTFDNYLQVAREGHPRPDALDSLHMGGHIKSSPRPVQRPVSKTRPKPRPSKPTSFTIAGNG